MSDAPPASVSPAAGASSSAPAPAPRDGLGARLLRKVGYKGHGGLGKEERGRVAPIQVALKRDRRGLGTARAYAIVGDDNDDAKAKAHDASLERRTGARAASTAATDEDAEGEAREAKRSRASVERARAAQKAKRDADIARTIYRAFKDDDTRHGSGRDANPLLRTGMSRSNPLRRVAR